MANIDSFLNPTNPEDNPPPNPQVGDAIPNALSGAVFGVSSNGAPLMPVTQSLLQGFNIAPAQAPAPTPGFIPKINTP